MRRMNSALRDVGRGAEDHDLWVNPLDAAAAGVADGDRVDVTSSTGTISGRARVTDDVVAGAVSIPHGLVDQNVSVLTSSGVGTTDALTGMVVQSGITITIRPQEPPFAIAVTDARAVPVSERSSASVPGSTSWRT